MKISRWFLRKSTKCMLIIHSLQLKYLHTYKTRISFKRSASTIKRNMPHSSLPVVLILVRPYRPWPSNHHSQNRKKKRYTQELNYSIKQDAAERSPSHIIVSLGANSWCLSANAKTYGAIKSAAFNAAVCAKYLTSTSSSCWSFSRFGRICFWISSKPIGVGPGRAPPFAFALSEDRVPSAGSCRRTEIRVS